METFHHLIFNPTQYPTYFIVGEKYRIGNGRLYLLKQVQESGLVLEEVKESGRLQMEADQCPSTT